MAYTELLSTHGLSAEQWDAGIFEEYLGQLFWMKFMGTGESAVIQVKDDLTKKPGDAITFGIQSELIGGKVTGSNKGIGNEGRVEFYDERVTIDNVRHLVKFEDIPMSQKRSPGWDILERGRRALIRKNKFDLEDTITSTLASVTEGRVRGRYLYGKDDSNWDATHATAMQALDTTNDLLTIAAATKMKRKALGRGGTPATAKMMPMQIKVGDGYEEWFPFVGPVECLRDLTDSDAVWRNSELNLPPSAGSRSSVIFTGNSFKGARNGMLFYEWDRMPVIPITAGANTIVAGHCFLLGAQALILAWGQRSKFGEEPFDVGHDVVYETHEIRGMVKTVWDRNTVSGASNEDHGVVHGFFSAAADA